MFLKAGIFEWKSSYSKAHMRNILIVYYYLQYPPRATIMDHLYSFARHSGQRCFYLNLAVRDVPAYLENFPFDIIVFHNIFLSPRWHLPIFERAVKKAHCLKENPSVKVALLQDEFVQMDVVCDFINEFGIQHVFSVSPPSEWPKIYKTVDFKNVRFYQVLTGYLEERTLKKVNRLAKNSTARTVDIGYRSRQVEPWQGRHGCLKTQVADLFQKRAPMKGLTTDISIRNEDTFLGDDWYKFLLRCKYTIGVEGGASLLDWDGTVRQKTRSYMSQHPQDSFDEIEAACFPGLDGSLGLFAISPRHLEACATKTCQVLIEGDYNGVLTAGRHYIELKRDFSNLDHVLDALKNDTVRDEIVENAYRDIVQSGRYHYSGFVRFMLEPLSLGVAPRNVSPVKMPGVWLAWRWTKLVDVLSWQRIRFYLKFAMVTGAIAAWLPEPLRVLLRRWKQAILFRA